MASGVEQLQEQGIASESLAGRSAASPTLPTWLMGRLDTLTGGHAHEGLRVISFLFMGGLAALVNLLGTWFFARYTSLPHGVYTILATEISLLCSFVLNDRFTFRSLIDSRRPYWLRCIRFHGPAAVGFLFTLLVSDAGYYLAHLPSLIAQSVALILATVVNFVMHRFWTYRAAKVKPARLQA